MKKIVIIGGGTAGCMLANLLARGLTSEMEQKEAEITVISNKKEHTYQPGYLYIPFGLKKPEDIIRPVAEVLHPSVRLVFDNATEIDQEKQQISTAQNGSFSYDYLVIATGSHPQVEEVPGLAEAGHIFYSMEGALKLQQAMEEFEGGKVIVAVGLPHKCPVAPLEFTMMFEDWCREKGIRDNTSITYCYPLARAYGTASVADMAEKEFNSRDIQIETYFMLDHVDPKKKELVSMDGTRLPFDLLVVIPPHKGSEFVRNNNLGCDEGWLPTHRNFLNLENSETIYCLGDATNLPISKAGSTAHFESEILAENIIDKIRGGRGKKPYHGKVFCFIETGLHKATYITFDYNNPPKPVTPSKTVHWGKLSYNNVHWVNLKGIM